jgi:ribosome-associated translation inhibitor RaiA
MTDTPTVVIRFKDVEHDEVLRQELERRTHDLAAEFPGTTRFEVHLEPDGTGFRVHGHVNGKHTQLATHGQGPDPRSAADQLFHRVRQQLRRVRDKRIFQLRKEAQKSGPKH